MARSTFGGTANDLVFRPYGFGRRSLLALATESITWLFYDAESGGSLITDLLQAGSPVTSIVTTGHQWPSFQGPDGVTAMWADDGDPGTPRQRIEARDLAAIAAAVVDAVSARDEAVATVGSKASKDTITYLSSDHGVVGDDTIDDSSQFQSWLDTAASLGLVARLHGGAVVRLASAISIPTGSRLDLNGGRLRNASTSVNGRMINIVSVSDVWIGNGVLDGDKASFASATEQRHNIRIVDSDRVTIENVLSRDAKGDGIYIGDDTSGISSDVTLISFRAEGNHRNGGSVTACSGLRQFGGYYRGNGGTSPHAGFDIEPNIDGVETSDGAFYGVSFDANVGDGLLVQAKSASPTEPQRGWRCYGCTASGNGTGAIATFGHGVILRWATDFAWVGGEIRENLRRGVYFRDTLTNIRFDTDVISNGEEGYGQPAGTITGLKITGYISGNGTSAAAGTYDGVNLAGSGVGLAFDATSGGAQQRYGLRTVSGWSYVSVGPGSHFPSNATGTTSLGDDVGTRTQVASELAWRIGRASSSDTAFVSRTTSDTVDRFGFRIDGRMQWSSGTAAIDVTLERTAVGTVGTGAGHAIRTGRAVTGSRPSAATVGNGAMFYDTTLSKPIWSDGTNWKDATGTTV